MGQGNTPGTGIYQAWTTRGVWLASIYNGLEDLTPLIQSTPVIQKTWTDIAYTMRVKSYVPGGGIAMLPHDADTEQMLYRADLFEDATLNPNDLPPPQTLEEWATLSELFHGKDLNGDGIPHEDRLRLSSPSPTLSPSHAPSL